MAEPLQPFTTWQEQTAAAQELKAAHSDDEVCPRCMRRTCTCPCPCPCGCSHQDST